MRLIIYDDVKNRVCTDAIRRTSRGIDVGRIKNFKIKEIIGKKHSAGLFGIS